MASIRKNIRNGAIWSVVLSGSRVGLQFLSTIILAHLLSPDDFGLIGMLAIFIAVSETLMDAGLGGALIRKRDASPEDFGTLTSYNIGVSIALYLIIFLAAPWVARFYEKPILTNLLRIYGLVLIIEAIAIVPRVQLIRAFKFKTSALIGLVSGLFGLLIAIVMALVGLGVYSLLGQLVLSSILSSALFLFYSKYKLFFCFSRNSFRNLFGFGFNTTLGNLIMSFAENIFTNVIGKVAPLYLTGYFNQSYKMQKMVSSVQTTIIDNALFPVLSKEDDDRIVELSIRINYLAGYIVVFLYSLLIFNAHLIVQVLLGDQWLGMVPYLKLLLLGGIFQSFTAFNRNIFKTLAETTSIVLCEAISLIFLVTLIITMSFGVEAIIYTFIGYAFFRWQVSVVMLVRNGHLTYMAYMKDFLLAVIPTLLGFIVFAGLKVAINPMINGLLLSVMLTILVVSIGELTKNKQYIEIKEIIRNTIHKSN